MAVYYLSRSVKTCPPGERVDMRILRHPHYTSSSQGMGMGLNKEGAMMGRDHLSKWTIVGLAHSGNAMANLYN